jgi:hypothetical protein
LGYEPFDAASGAAAVRNRIEAPMFDVVVPAYNEEADLEPSYGICTPI